MTNLASLLGIPPDAAPAWVKLVTALDRLADQGRRPVCATRPDDWGSDAPAHARQAAVEACHHCPVKQPCSAYATAAREPGHVWGGQDRTPRPAKKRRQETPAA
jgi:hypothetical protein